jgi:hypothetical protein
MLSAKLRSISKVAQGRSKYGLAFAMVLVGALAPMIIRGIASAEVPFDGWNAGMHAEWVNRATVKWNGAFFIDGDTSDRPKEFGFQPVSNQNVACKSQIVWNWETLTPWKSETSPYDDDGVASEAGLFLKIPNSNGPDCNEVTKDGCNDSWTYINHGRGCRIHVDNVGAKLINFYIDTDGNVKSINPNQAITFAPAKGTWNGKNIYIRTDEAQAPCKDIMTQNGSGQWILFALKPGGSSNWKVYNDILNASTGVAGPFTGTPDKCDFDDNTFVRAYYGATAGSILHTGEGGYQVYVGGPQNQGASKAATAPGTTPGGTTPGGSAADITPTCESAGFSLNWILCPIFNATSNFVEWLLTNVIQPLLRTDDFLDTNGPVFQIWSQFRIYANIFLIIAVIVVVFGQTIGTAMFEAYMVRTFLSRLLLVIILVNLSIYLMAGFLDIVNVLGAGIGAAMTAPLHGAGLFKFTPTTTQQGGVALAVGSIGLGAAASGVIFGGLISPEAGIFVLLFVLLPAVFGVIAMIVTIVARRAILIGLTIASPIPAALKALPNTEKYSDKFVDLTATTAGVGIILPMIFAISNIMSYLVITVDQSPSRSLANAKFTSIIDMFLGFFFTFAPLLAGGLAFKWSGGLIARGHEFLSGVGKKGHAAILGNENDPNSLRNKARRRFGAAVTQGQADVLARGSDKDAGWVARQRARFVGSGLFGDVTQRQSDYNAIAAKQRSAKTDTGNDDEIFAGAGYRIRAGERDHLGNTSTSDRYFNSKGKEISEVLYNRGRRLHGANSHEVGESLMYTLGKAQNEDDKAAFRYSFAKNAMDQGWSDGEMIGAYAHAAYPHKRNHAAVWYSMPEYERNASGQVTGVKFNDVGAYQTDKKTGNQVHTSYDGMIEDLHKSRGSFDLSGDRHEDFQVMRAWQKELEDKVIAGNATEADLDALGKTHEVFDAVSQRMQTVPNGDGEPSTSGASAASQAVILAAVSERRLGMTRQDQQGGAVFFDASSAARTGPNPYRPGSRPENLPVATGGGTVAPLGVFKSTGGTYGSGTAPATAPRERMPDVVRL